jgi:hypothetical protein
LYQKKNQPDGLKPAVNHTINRSLMFRADIVRRTAMMGAGMREGRKPEVLQTAQLHPFLPESLRAAAMTLYDIRTRSEERPMMENKDSDNGWCLVL